jgi:hypothetical protein
MARTIDGICNYCGQQGRVNWYDASPLATRWCPDTDACDERWLDRTAAGRGAVVLTTTNTVTVTTTVTTTTTRTTRKGRPS